MLFTPRLAVTDQERLRMDISVEDMKKTAIHNPRWKAEVTDQNTGKRYLVRGAACSLPNCFCDAVILKNLGEDDRLKRGDATVPPSQE